jgi:polysaccharide deacetylase family protein (PEP-CTERM system associated)
MTSPQPATFDEKVWTAPRREGRIVNAMSVDVEDYFQVQALEAQFPRESWPDQQQRVEQNTQRILDIFAANGVKATFFTLGWVARRCPALIRRIVADGHEIASHGSDHRRADAQTPAQFLDDVKDAKSVLEDISGSLVLGYRAPSFSIAEGNLWAFDVLAEAGYRYSSSVYPVRRDFYGMPSAPRVPFFPGSDHAIEEYPVSTVRLAGRNLPAGGGGFFRLLPLAVTSAAIAWVNRHDKRSCIFYVHPWELDPGQPRPAGVPLKSRFRHYLNLDIAERRLADLSGRFCWDRLDNVFGAADFRSPGAVGPQ